jgi:hypothetical protein
MAGGDSGSDVAGTKIPKPTETDPGIMFQYWPESLNDSRPSEWNPRSIPGGSHPIYQWTHGGERRLSFTAVFTRDHQPPGPARGGALGVLDNITDFGENAAEIIGLGGPGVGDMRNVPIESAVSWLRYFTYPYYKKGDLRVFEPPKGLLILPGSKLGHQGTDDVLTVMTGCDVTYEAWFPTGEPRIVEVALEFAEVVQGRGRVEFHNRANMRIASGVAGYDESGRPSPEKLGVPGDTGDGSLLDDISGAIASPLGF